VKAFQNLSKEAQHFTQNIHIPRPFAYAYQHESSDGRDNLDLPPKCRQSSPSAGHADLSNIIPVPIAIRETLINTK
jgi:hypothetical protein